MEILKIKDDIPLQILKDYGFESCHLVRFLDKYAYASRCGTTTYRIWVRKDRTISINSPSNKVYTVLFDMITDGIIEKGVINKVKK